VTQLVVRRGYRERHVATGMLRRLGEEVEGVDVWGVASCNPAAVLAVGGAFGEVLAFFPLSSLLPVFHCFRPFFPIFFPSPTPPPPYFSPPLFLPSPPPLPPLHIPLSLSHPTNPSQPHQAQNSSQLTPLPLRIAPRKAHRSRFYPPARRTHPPLLANSIPSERETPGIRWRGFSCVGMVEVVER